MAADADALHVERNNLSELLPFRYYRCLKVLYDMLEFKHVEDRHFRVHLAELKQKV